MTIAAIFGTIVFSTVLSVIEIPKMIHEKLTRELWTFCILLAIGTILAILKSLDLYIPNPSDFVAWIYSPLKNVMKSLLQ